MLSSKETALIKMFQTFCQRFASRFGFRLVRFDHCASRYFAEPNATFNYLNGPNFTLPKSAMEAIMETDYA